MVIFIKMGEIVKRLLFIIFLISLTSTVYAYPPLPTEFYGTIMYYNEKAPANYHITAKSQNTTCGLFLIKNTGYFGVLSCKGDINDTSILEGPVNDEEVKFSFRGEEATIFGDATYEPGEYKNLSLIVPKIVCGDKFCQKTYETCLYCQVDCGQCLTTNQTIPPNRTNTIPPPGGGGGGGGGAAGGGAGGGTGGGTGGQGGISNIIINVSQLNNAPVSCKENWNCTDWSECFSNETQSRICIDNNNCNTTKNKLPELQECIYFGNCFDGIKNGKEIEIDCGGPCRPCPGYEGEPNCFDGIKNCHDGECEEGVDCGGVCIDECEKPKKIEQPLRICNNPTDIFRFDFLLIYIIILIFMIIYVTIEKERERHIKRDMRL